MNRNYTYTSKKSFLSIFCPIWLYVMKALIGYYPVTMEIMEFFINIDKLFIHPKFVYLTLSLFN
jgi:hypothetical protein